MQEVTELLGQFSNPNLQSVAEMLNIAGHSGHSFLFKTDVSGAFSTMKLSPEAALSQSIQFGDYILIPLVSLFGWSATPAYYNIVSKAIDWAHNGGVSVSIFSGWCMQQNVEMVPSVHSQSLAVAKSLTYVDDTFGPCSLETATKVMSDVCVIIRQLLGPDSVNNKKTEGPSAELQLIGWRCDMVSRTMRPSVNGIKKMIWWLFRGVRVENGEFKISLADLRKLLGLLRWYQAVIPFASTFSLQAFLTLRERRALGKTRMDEKSISIRHSAALQELKHWRHMIVQGLANESCWSAPMWFLAKATSDQCDFEIWTDAATSVGGGYHLPFSTVSSDGSSGHFGQFLWSDEERYIFGTAALESTDINVLEFVTAILAVITERETLRGHVVRINVDNTAAISWLNKLRVKHEWGQMWVALLVYVMLEYKIIIVCLHIAGIANTVADDLSRFLQACRLRLLEEGYRQSIMPSTVSRTSIWKASSQDCDRTQTFIQQWLTRVA
jgi:hypothetical protein